MATISLTALGAAALVDGLPRQAGAQVPSREVQRLPEVARSAASVADATSLRLNPASLAFLPGSELRWTGTFTQPGSSTPWQGHAVSLGLPLGLGLSTGLRLDLVSPGQTASLDDYRWLTWGFGFRTSRTSALGVSYQKAFAEADEVDGLTGWSLAWTARLSEAFAASMVAENFNGPGRGESAVSPDYSLGVAWRPGGTRSVEVSLEGHYQSGLDSWSPRALVGVDVASWARIRGEVQVQDITDSAERGWMAGLGLGVALNQPHTSSAFDAVALGGDALGGWDGIGAQLSAAVRGFTEPGAPVPGRLGARIRIESTPDSREHVELLRRLWRLAEQPEIDAMLLELRASPAGTLAHGQELRDALALARQAGKTVVCYLHDAGPAELFTCAGANRILMHPAGSLQLAGVSRSQMYFGRLLDKLGVAAEVVQIGAHKSAMEPFARQGASETARADSVDRLQQYELQFIGGVAAGRGHSADRVRTALAGGPYLATGARSAGWVDELAFDDEVDDQVAKLVGHPVALVEQPLSPEAPATFEAGSSIALVYLDGEMVDGRSEHAPLIGRRTAGAVTVSEALKRVRESEHVGAVVLRIDSPGGSALAADRLWREVQLTARRKPVVVSMGGYAASGGYYVAAPAARIFANPFSLTGSIGVFSAKADLSRLLARVGVDIEVYKSTPQADADAPYRPWSDDERHALEARLDQTYRLFLQRVADGRAMKVEAVDAVGQGRVWTGEQAQTKGLVDELGGLRQAFAHARRLAHLPDSAPVVELPKVPRGLFSRLSSIPMREASLADRWAPFLAGLLAPLSEDLGVLWVHAPGAVLARLPERTVPQGFENDETAEGF